MGETVKVEARPLTAEIQELSERLTVETGERPNIYPQALGGSLNIAFVRYLADVANDSEAPLPPFVDSLNATFDKVKQNGEPTFCVDGRFGEVTDKGYNLGLHRGSHATEEASDCGFADKWPQIFETLATRQDEIASIINGVAPDSINDSNQQRWLELVEAAGTVAKAAQTNNEQFLRGERLIKTLESRGDVSLQAVEGEHNEEAAQVTATAGKTFDTAGANAQGRQLFNLDLLPVLEQSGQLGINEEDAKLLTLGLYVATEMILVETKGYRLPIIIK